MDVAIKSCCTFRAWYSKSPPPPQSVMQWWCQGMVRGLYSPHQNMLAPPLEGEKAMLWRFFVFLVP